MKCVMIVGGPGSGRSTLARELGSRLGLPDFHMDQPHRQESWVERPMAETLPLAQAMEEQDRWVCASSSPMMVLERISVQGGCR